MTIAALNPAAGSPAPLAGPARAGATASIDETEDRFLKLLVAQMRNQDPLSPLDNAQVTTQLAQINTVQGIDRLNAAMQRMLDGSKAGSTSELAAMVGRRVLVDGDALELPAEGAARAGFELAEPASSVRIEVLDRSGAVVDTRRLQNLPAGLQTFDWDGTVNGARRDAGAYTLRLSAVDGERPVTATPLAAVPVQAVLRGADGDRLHLGTLGTRTLAEVRGVL
jgi:flagellar basal-body rod modification protein FlgD